MAVLCQFSVEGLCCICITTGCIQAPSVCATNLFGSGANLTGVGGDLVSATKFCGCTTPALDASVASYFRIRASTATCVSITNIGCRDKITIDYLSNCSQPVYLPACFVHTSGLCTYSGPGVSAQAQNRVPSTGSGYPVQALVVTDFRHVCGCWMGTSYVACSYSGCGSPLYPTNVNAASCMASAICGTLLGGWANPTYCGNKNELIEYPLTLSGCNEGSRALEGSTGLVGNQYNQSSGSGSVCNGVCLLCCNSKGSGGGALANFTKGKWYGTITCNPSYNVSSPVIWCKANRRHMALNTEYMCFPVSRNFEILKEIEQVDNPLQKCMARAWEPVTLVSVVNGACCVYAFTPMSVSVKCDLLFGVLYCSGGQRAFSAISLSDSEKGYMRFRQAFCFEVGTDCNSFQYSRYHNFDTCSVPLSIVSRCFKCSDEGRDEVTGRIISAKVFLNPNEDLICPMCFCLQCRTCTCAELAECVRCGQCNLWMLATSADGQFLLTCDMHTCAFEVYCNGSGCTPCAQPSMGIFACVCTSGLNASLKFHCMCVDCMTGASLYVDNALCHIFYSHACQCNGVGGGCIKIFTRKTDCSGYVCSLTTSCTNVLLPDGSLCAIRWAFVCHEKCCIYSCASYPTACTGCTSGWGACFDGAACTWVVGAPWNCAGGACDIIGIHEHDVRYSNWGSFAIDPSGNVVSPLGRHKLTCTQLAAL